MTYRRAFTAGDRIKVGDSVDDVIEMRLQGTHLRSIENEEIGAGDFTAPLRTHRCRLRSRRCSGSSPPSPARTVRLQLVDVSRSSRRTRRRRAEYTRFCASRSLNITPVIR
jgi:hypothetical protein